MTRKVRLTIFCLLSVGLVVFIFSNSVQSPDESNAASGWVAAFLRPLLNPHGRLSDEVYHKLVRKLAHFTEFGMLGFCLGGVAVNALWRGRWLFAAAAVILTAFADETIQSFTERTNSIIDVAIDSAGALCGLAAMTVIVQLIRAYKRKKPLQ